MSAIAYGMYSPGALCKIMACTLGLNLYINVGASDFSGLSAVPIELFRITHVHDLL